MNILKDIRPGLFFVLCIQALSTYGQNPRLAEHYLNQAEYEKAAVLYEKIYHKNPGNDKIFEQYIRSLLLIPQIDRARKEIDQYIKSNPQPTTGYLMLANLHEQQGDIDAANKIIQKAITELPADPNEIVVFANALIKKSRFEDAIRTIEYAESKLGLKGAFERELATYYLYAGDFEEMITKHLDLIEKYPASQEEVRTIWNDYFSDDNYEQALQQIFRRIQKAPQSIALAELLSWTYIRLGRYNAALKQLIALDTRSNADGAAVFQLGKEAFEAKAYDVAEKAFTYILDSKEKANAFYVPAKFSLLTTYKQQYSHKYNVDREKMNFIASEYASFFEEFPVDDNNIMMLHDWASILAFELDSTEEATEIIENIIAKKGLNKYGIGNLKLLLGDIYLLAGDRWEATLLYSQVDKEFREGLLGEKARFMNAKLSYYMGDFDWAQTQFEVLKSATSRLISNDAIDISVFITDNLGLDTSVHAITDFATAEFLRFKKDYVQSEQLLMAMLESYPDHSLTDDIYYELANLYRDQSQWEKALDFYQKIVDNHIEEIRCDNALYEMAQIYDKALQNTSEAMTLYERLFAEFPFSTFSVNARKRFRELRGDDVE